MSEEEYSDNEQLQQDEEDSQNQMGDSDNDEGDDSDEGEDKDEVQKRLEEEEKLIKEQLKTASFETIMKIKQQQRELQIQQEQLKSEKKRPKSKQPSKDARSSSAGSSNDNQQKRAKGAPIERNAKMPVSVYQNVISSKKVINHKQKQQQQKQFGRDPRFDGLSGQFNQTYFNNSYGFIDDMKRSEIKILQKDVKKKKFSKEEKQVLKNELGKIKGELKTKEHNDRKQEVMNKYKEQAKQSISKGQLPFFAKKSQIKDDVLKLQYDKLKQTGKLEDTLKRKRKQQSDKLMSAYHLITHKKQKPN